MKGGNGALRIAHCLATPKAVWACHDAIFRSGIVIESEELRRDEIRDAVVVGLLSAPNHLFEVVEPSLIHTSAVRIFAFISTDNTDLLRICSIARSRVRVSA